MGTPYYTMDPNAGFPGGFPVPTQSPSNQMAFYPNSMPQYPQPKTPQQPGQQQHSFGAMPMQPGGPGGAMMPSGIPQHSSSPMDAFSTAFAQPTVPASMPQFSQPGIAHNQPSTVQQTFNQNMASLNANMLANQPKPQMHQMNPQMNPQMTSQMNSPQTTQPGTPVQGQNPAQAQAQAQMQAQMQAQAAAREKARVSVLLEINTLLLQEVINLQAAGKGGSAPNADANADQGSDAPKPAPKPTPSQEYIECMRRLQANLSYLANTAERAKKPGSAAPQAPALLTPPANVPAVHELYNKLNELFPRSSQTGTPQKLSPGMMQGNGGPSPSPVSESVV